MTRPDKTFLPVGKLPIEHLRSLLADLPGRDPRLLHDTRLQRAILSVSKGCHDQLSQHVTAR